MRKKTRKSKNFNINQRSFFFEDYLETNQKQKIISKSPISEDRIYILFFSFFCLITIFSFKIILISFQTPQFLEVKKNHQNFLPLRRDVVDRNGVLISRNIKAYHAAVKPNFIKDKKKFLLNIKINFPEIDQVYLNERLKKNKYFYLKKRLTDGEKNQLWSLGEKGIILESYQSRVYPHANLYSHILGQIDNDNYGISGIERFFDKELKNMNKIKEPFYLTLDTNIQYIIKRELEDSLNDFKAIGAAGLLMNAKNGEVISLVSLPDYNINKRDEISNSLYTNKITKGVFELGSIFKTFTIALALEENLYKPETIIKNIPQEIKCSKYKISDIKKFPQNMSLEDILIRSSNIGTLMVAREIGQARFKNFLKNLNILSKPDFELDEIGTPLSFNWEKCKLETVAFGHGITTTPLQAAAAYAAISNGGYMIKPTISKFSNSKTIIEERIISESTSKSVNKILRKVVTDKEGTASLADIYGFNVGGKTGTAKKYGTENKNINTFISIFPETDPKYVLLVMLDEPKGAPEISYNYRGNIISGISRNEAGWNAVYVAGKIIKKIGPILAINNDEVYNNHVVKKSN